MTGLLARIGEGHVVGAGLLRLIDHVRTLQMPTRSGYVEGLAELGHDGIQAGLLVLTGVVFLFFGYRFFKVLVIANAAVLGGMIGCYIGLAATKSQNVALLLGLVAAVLLAALSWPLLKYSVCVMGAVAGAVVGTAAWHVVTQAMGNPAPLRFAWVGGLIGMVVVGVLTFIVFRASVMLFTALQGSAMIVSGAVALLMLDEGLRQAIAPALIDNRYLIHALVGVPAVAGFACQFAAEHGRTVRRAGGETNPATKGDHRA